MTKIDIISGFLGAGKTTLIKKIISEGYVGEKIVLIENEFGEIGIDGGFLKDAGIEINEMNSGCICCSLVGDFETALKDVVSKYSPDRIIIEPSGVGKLSDVIKAVEAVTASSDLSLNAYVTVVDTLKCKMYMKNFGEFFNNQIENAKTIILSRTANQSQDKLEATVALIREHNVEANIITTDWAEIDGKTIVSAMEQISLVEEMLKEAQEEYCCGHDHHDHEHHHEDGEPCSCGHDHHDHEHHHEDGEPCSCGHDHHDHEHHHAEDVFSSWGQETPKKYTREDIKDILVELTNTNAYGVILRAKGMLPAEDGTWTYFDMVPGEYEIREGSPDYTGKICVIGSELREDELAKLFMLR